MARRRLPTHTGPQHRVPLGRLARRNGDIFSDNGTKASSSGTFRWLISTSLAGIVGAVSVGAVILGSTDASNTSREIKDFIRQPTIQRAVITPALQTEPTSSMRWAILKADRLQNMSGALSARFLIHDTMRQRRGNRDVIVKQAFVRLVARLSPVTAAEAERVPPFNPLKLYAAAGGGDDGTGQNPGDDSQDISTRLVELLGDLLPAEDGFELDTAGVNDLVLRALANQDELTPGGSLIRGAYEPEGLAKLTAQELLAGRSQRAPFEPLPPNTTALSKSIFDSDDTPQDLEAREVRVVKVARNQTLTRILLDLGGDRVQVKLMIDAGKSFVADTALLPGYEVHVTLVPSLTRLNTKEPVRLSVFGDTQDHKLTVTRNAAGEFAASATPLDDRNAGAAIGNEDTAQVASLYTSFYHAGLSQGLPHEQINQIMRIHAYDTDFRRRVRGVEQVEWFFDTKDDDKGLDAALGDLLMAAVTAGGESQRFYRFRSSDGVIDYYDEAGNTSRKFLMRRPVRGEGMRLGSGFGMRRHPILGMVRPHNGVDWSGPIGTPIMAAGSGTIEEAGRKGEYGNYVRIRHANGYRTSYAHMRGFAAGISEGVRVRQGQVIGFLGTTGLSTGPHLHYEVLVNSRPVDPMSLQVPKDRKLTGTALRDFLKEKGRVDDLLRRNPVSSRIIDQQAALRQ